MKMRMRMEFELLSESELERLFQDALRVKFRKDWYPKPFLI